MNGEHTVVVLSASGNWAKDESLAGAFDKLRPLTAGDQYLCRVITAGPDEVRVSRYGEILYPAHATCLDLGLFKGRVRSVATTPKTKGGKP